MYTEISRFEWDHWKARRNAQRHGIRFSEAATAFDDPFGRFDEDAAHSQLERRQRFIGETSQGQLLMIIFTMRAGPRIRLISARRANRKERILYAFNRHISFS